MIEDFSNVVQQGHQIGLLKTFVVEELSPQRMEEKGGTSYYSKLQVPCLQISIITLTYIHPTEQRCS